MPGQDLQVDLLGPPEVQVGGQALDVDTRKAVAILAMLAVDGSQARARLAAMLWPESDTSRARAALRRTLSVLHRGLGEGRLASSRATVVLEGSFDCDVLVVDRELAEVGGHVHGDGACAECQERLERVIGLHRGPFMDGFGLRDSPGFDDWQAERAEHRRRELIRVLDLATRFHLEGDDLGAALTTTQRWNALDPLNEQVHRRLMLLHAWRGERAEAIHRYRACVAVLDREIGVTPLARTTDLYRAILDDRVPPRSRPGGPPAVSGGPVAARKVVPGREAGSRAGAAEQLFVGRREELARLEAAHAEAAGQLVVVAGEAGIGKSRLADEAVARFEAAGARTAVARCHPGEIALAFGPIVELLGLAVGQAPVSRVAALSPVQRAEIARLVPDLVDDPELPALAPLSSPGAQSRFFETVWDVLEHTLSEDGRGVVMIDDLHGVDAASLELIGYGLRRLAERNLTIVVCIRPEEVGASSPVSRLLDEVAGEGKVVLRRLTSAEVGTLLTTALGERDDPAITELIVSESEGLPLLVVEYLRFVQDRAHDEEPVVTQLGDLLPRGATELARSRLSGVSETAHQVASTAATIGRSFDLAVVLRASGRTEDEVVDGLDELVSRHLVRELPAGDVHEGQIHYDFVHDKIRRAIYEATSLARRRLLHGRVAEAIAAIVARPGSSPGALAAVIGEHHRRGGNEADAAEWFAVAGDHARTLFANGDAVEHYDRALALGHPDPGRLHARTGELRTLMGDYPGALAALELAAAQAHADADLAEVEHQLGDLHLRLGDLDTAAAHLDRAAALAARDPDRLARVAADRALAALRADDLEAADRAAEDARTHAGVSGDVEARAGARNVLGLVARHRGEHAVARDHFAASLELATELADPSARIAATNNLALATAASGDVDAALALAEEAVALGATRGDRHREAALRNNLADLLHQAGREQESMASLREAVTLFAEVGDDPDRLLPEVWKLTEW